MTSAGQTIFEKIWSRHVVRMLDDGTTLIHIDRHILQETTCVQAFAGLHRQGRGVACPDLTFGVTDHIVSTKPGRTAESFPEGREYLTLMEQNCRRHGIRLFDLSDRRQGIEHVVAPELGLSLPGCTIVCADSHTATNGALGALAWGFGTTDVEHVLATQTLPIRKPSTLRIDIGGRLAKGVFAKDVILHVIGQLGTTAGRGCFVEYTGPLIRSLSLEERMTICNMSIELGSRCGTIAPDDATFQYVHGREFAPRGEAWDRALAHWRTLPSDPDARYDRSASVDCSVLAPQITWGITQAQVADISGRVPDPKDFVSADDRQSAARALDYMGLTPGERLDSIPVDYAFIGSCTNGRLSDLQAAAAVIRGRQVAPGVRALVVPGSTSVKAEAEQLGLDRIFRQAGFEWRESGCSMCLGINDDQVPPGKRCISSSNRNFENRQGPNSRTHLAVRPWSPQRR